MLGDEAAKAFYSYTQVCMWSSFPVFLADGTVSNGPVVPCVGPQKIMKLNNFGLAI